MAKKTGTTLHSNKYTPFTQFHLLHSFIVKGDLICSSYLYICCKQTVQGSAR